MGFRVGRSEVKRCEVKRCEIHEGAGFRQPAEQLPNPLVEIRQSTICDSFGAERLHRAVAGRRLVLCGVPQATFQTGLPSAIVRIPHLTGTDCAHPHGSVCASAHPRPDARMSVQSHGG